MIVTFRSNAHADIIMFGDVGVNLLKLMGHSGNAPSALLAEDVSAALRNGPQDLDNQLSETSEA